MISQREKVFKRICQLTKMKNAVDFYRHNPTKFPFKIPWKLFICKDITHVKHWGSIQEYGLCNLILLYGFGNWDNILNDRLLWWGWMGVENKSLSF
jgi:hypothetical protein